MELEIDDNIASCFPNLMKKDLKSKLCDFTKRLVKISAEENQNRIDTVERSAEAKNQNPIDVQTQSIIDANENCIKRELVQFYKTD